MNRAGEARHEEAREATFDLEAMRSDVARGLLGQSKCLPSKYFYDARGSALFDRITALPEYYLTEAEREILVTGASRIIELAGAPSTLVEFGPGSADKTRILIASALRSVPRLLYVPVDVSRAYLQRLRTTFAADHEPLEVRAIQADFTRELALPTDLPRPALHALLGSSIGNFRARDAERLLRRIRQQVGPADTFLLGVDLHKDPATLEAAYNDSEGVTAAFNRNVLRVLNACLGSDFDPGGFEHQASYDEAERRIEMRLVARTEHRVKVPGVGEVGFRAGESILTEYSHKYDRDTVEGMLRSAGLRMERWLTDERGRFGVALSRP